MNSRLWLTCTLVTCAWLVFTLQKANPWPKLSDGTTLEIRTVPAGAQVQIDDQPVGMSDGLFSVQPGRRQVRVRKIGYREATVTVEVAKGKHLLQAVQLDPKKSQVSLTNTAAGDEFWLGPGKPRKVKKQDLQELDPGFYEVWATREGRESERLEIALEPEQKKTLALQWLSGKAEVVPETPTQERKPERPLSTPTRVSSEVQDVPAYQPLPSQNIPRAPRVYQPAPTYVPQAIITPIPEPAAPSYPRNPEPASHSEPVPAPIFTPLP